MKTCEEPLLVIIVSLFLAINCNAGSYQPKCLESNSHKPIPEKEIDLFGECKNWKDLSCCSKNTSETIHLVDTKWQNFNYDHCAPLSSQCRRHFQRELCFYECDPYLSKYIVKDKSKKFRSERYYQIPLCKADCDSWFNACQFDFTCRDNWNRGFKWSKGVNSCHPQDKCKTFKDMYKTAENFCSLIWDESFKVVNNTSEKCFSFTFELNANLPTNPNRQIADYYNDKEI